MKIIDFEKKGNVVRFYLGIDELKDWHGDDWNDAPYNLNAGPVYDNYITSYKDIAFPFDDLVLEPCEEVFNCQWTKDDMKHRQVPCIIVIPHTFVENSWYGQDFNHWLGVDGIKKYYFGDKMEE